MKRTEDILGWFNYKGTYNYLVSKMPSDGIFVECGAWRGKSSSYLCDICKGRFKIFIVDSWKDTVRGTKFPEQYPENLYDIFLENMGDREFTPIKKYSHEAVKDFEDESCDIVFLDMDHIYEGIKLDIELWLPKVKRGGILAGHDYICEGYPDVKIAVDELLGEENIKKSGGGCWIYEKI